MKRSENYKKLLVGLYTGIPADKVTKLVMLLDDCMLDSFEDGYEKGLGMRKIRKEVYENAKKKI